MNAQRNGRANHRWAADPDLEPPQGAALPAESQVLGCKRQRRKVRIPVPDEIDDLAAIL
ncbi:MAG: hypothetical protein ACREFN_19820 [Acetobacteraceae bacterium]